MRVLIPVLIAIASVNAATLATRDCACPDTDWGPPIVTTAAGGTNGLIVCGGVDSTASGFTRVSGFELARCRDGKKLVEFSEAENADLRVVGDDVEVTRLDRAPVGKRWEWTYMDVASAVVSASDSSVKSWRPRVVRPHVQSADVQRFLAEYRRHVRGGGAYGPRHLYGVDDGAVGQLFVAALAGNAEAQRLFCRMRRDVFVDGAAAEAYDSYLDDLALGVPHRASETLACLTKLRRVPLHA